MLRLDQIKIYIKHLLSRVTPAILSQRLPNGITARVPLHNIEDTHVDSGQLSTRFLSQLIDKEQIVSEKRVS